ncbi:MAG: NAD(P)/FAD-dependent oxidoreductase [Litorilinea sp.]
MPQLPAADAAQRPGRAHPPLQIAIIGGGIAGLTAAYDLARQSPVAVGAQRVPLAVTVYESSDRLGGLAAGFRGRPEWEWPLEHFYHHLFTNDDAIIGLTHELGLGSALEIHKPTTALFAEGHNYPLDTPLRVLQFPRIPIWDRLRMGLVLAYLRYHPARPWRTFDRIQADSWLERWMGRRAYQAVWQPMLQGKFGPHFQEVNLAWFWARIYKRTPQLAYYRGGFQALVDGLAAACRAAGVQIHTNAPVRAVTRAADNTFEVTLAADAAATPDAADPAPQPYARVLSTVSPGLMQRIAPDLPATYTAQLAALRSTGAIVLTIALDRQLMTDGVYWANIPSTAGLPFLALVEHTNMIDPRHYGGDHLLYIGHYLPPDHPYFDMSTAELLAEFSPHLRHFNAAFDPAWITGAWSHSARYAQPVPPVGYADMIPAVRTPWAGLYFASMSQVYPWDRGTNYAVEMGRDVAGMMLADLAQG